ncbi:DUF4251 domain-containing protein [Croceivirga sp. JEA036]|uniref:DUF4251 domain-containing protein n=1 Tax=Croceivirga sp. JEA036 TaxID=2721162 RepID=UPI00143A12E8|nr:DUF4251 domain-containing protein [Croceivirga sp. JEA036]NJB35643.1 DUF4251 domain-containing protein [Croceivirga sp. JEA036]
MNRLGLYLPFICLLLNACGPAKLSETEWHNLKLLPETLTENSLVFTANSANPMASMGIQSIANAGLLPLGSTATRINLNTNMYFLRLNKDSVTAALPYYGERQFGNTYNSTDLGIEFNTKPENFTITLNAKKKAQQIQFDVRTKEGEQLRVFGMVFGKRQASFQINSNYRNTIGYQGNYTLKEKPERP